MLEHVKRLLKGSAVYGLGSALNQGLALILLPLFTSYLTPTDYGIISVLSLWSTLMITLFSLGIGVSFGLAYYNTQEFDQDDVIWTAILILLLSSGLMLILNIILSKEISIFLLKNQTATKYIISYSMFSFFGIFVNLFTIICQTKEKPLKFMAATTISSITLILLSILFIVFMHYGVWGRILAVLLSSFISFALLFSQIDSKPKLALKLNIVKFLLKNGVLMLPSFFAIYVLQQGNTYIIQYHSGLEQAGLYAIGTNFGNGMSMLIQAFSMAWLPFAMSLKEKPKEAAYILGKISTYYVMAIGLITMLFFIYSKPLILIFTQPEFYDSHKIIGISALNFFLLGFFNIINIECYISQNLRPIVITQVISSIIFVSISLKLTEWYQAWGASWALVIANTFIILTLLIWNRKSKKNNFNIIYEKKSVYIILSYLIFILFNQLQSSKFNLYQIVLEHVFLIIIVISQYLMLEENEKSYIIKRLKLPN